MDDKEFCKQVETATGFDLDYLVCDMADKLGGYRYFCGEILRTMSDDAVRDALGFILRMYDLYDLED